MSSAGLPMYDLPALRPATDAWWAGLARAFRAEGLTDVPAAPMRGVAPERIWRRPDLLLAQTCGYPLMTRWRGRLTALAAPSYRAEGCAPGRYRSVVLVRETAEHEDIADLRGGTAAINGWDSQSGMNALRRLVAPHAEAGRFFARVLVTGRHFRSAAAVREGAADVAALDCVTWALMRAHAPADAAGLRVLCLSAAAPALPYVTRADLDTDSRTRLAAGLQRAAADPGLAAAREALLLDGFEPAADGDYDAVLAMEREAAQCGYPTLR